MQILFKMKAMRNLKFLLLVPLCFLLSATNVDNKGSQKKERLEIDTVFDVGQKGGCQDAKPFDATVSITVLPQRVEFEKDIEHINFAALTQQEIGKWVKRNNLYTYWIPEGHLKGGHLIMNGIGYGVDVERYTSAIDKGGNLICGYFSKVDITLFFASKIMMSTKFSDKDCEYDAYIKHMKKHNELDDEVFTEQIKKLKDGEVQELITFAEGDRYVLNNRWRLMGLERLQTTGISNAVAAYVMQIAQEAEYQDSKLDLGDEFLRLHEELKACKDSR